MAHGYAWIMWKSRMESAFRTGWACIMVGFAIEFYNARVHQPMDFQPFAYLTAMLILGEACLGEAMKGAVLALYATIQGVFPAFLSLWLIGPSRLSVWTIMLLVTVSGFLVTLPKSPHIVCKRVALGQIVIVYVAAFMQRGKGTDPSIYPLHAALSTGVGAAASVLALLVPVPRLACLKIEEKIGLVGDISYAMLRLLVDGYFAETVSSANAFLFQLNTIGVARDHLLTSVKTKQANIGWEKPLQSCLSPDSKSLLEKMFSLEKPLKRMEIALNSCSPFSISSPMSDKGIKDLLSVMAEIIGQSISSVAPSKLKNSRQVHVNDEQPMEISFEGLETVQEPSSYKDLPPLSFIFSMKRLYEDIATPHKQEEKTNKESENMAPKKKENRGCSLKIDTDGLLVAVKCSIALCLSVLFGILFTKDNGYWGGLAVAVSFASQREPTFKMASMRAHGTVLGSIYGVLGCFMIQRFEYLRYFFLIPWVIFTSFIKQSEMYGYAGGLTAFIGAVIILGRRNYGSPSQFAIERITETFFGILCCILVDLIFLPKRAASLARVRLIETLEDLNDCMSFTSCTKKPCLSYSDIKETVNRLKTHVTDLKNLIEEAKAEPDFWFMPFPHASYSQVLGSLSTLIELSDFMVDTIDCLPEISCIHMMSHSETYKPISGDLEAFRNCISSYLACFQDVLQVKSFKGLNEEYQMKNKESGDLESGKPQYIDLRDSDKIMDSFLKHVPDAVAYVDEGVKGVRIEMALRLGAMGFCMANMINEAKELEKGIQGILQRENPTAHVNLWEIHHIVMQLKILLNA